MTNIFDAIAAPFLRTPYNYDTDRVSDETGLKCDDPSRAQQHFKDECDVNTIVERFKITGQLPTNLRMPQPGDFSGIGSFHDAMNAIVQARETFDKMPANIRSRFGNDPANFLEFCYNPDNRDEARKLGLLVPGSEAPPIQGNTATAPANAEKPA